MTDANSSGPQTTPVNIGAKIGWVILIAATLYVCYFSHLGAIGFVGPDEPRYAWIARDMAETGDWVTPRLYGKPWFEKPPLLYWGAAVSFKLFGVSEAAARLPSAICALLATLALAWLAWRMYGAETARWLLLLLPTTVGMIGFSHAAATDMPFSGMLTVAMVCAAVVLRLTQDPAGTARPARADSVSPVAATTSPAPPATDTLGPSLESSAEASTPRLALLSFGFSLGLAVLAKGPAAIVLCGGAVFFWALFTKRWHDAFRLLHPAAIAAFCATSLPWYILCARRNSDFFRVFIIEHNFKRYLTPEFQHIQPFWFYVPVLLLAMFPWTPILLWTSVLGTAESVRTRRLREATTFLVSWAAFCVVFFTISQSKLPGYILPSLPAIGLLVAHSCTSVATRHRKSFGRLSMSFGLLSYAACLFLGKSHLRVVEKLGALERPAAILLLTLGTTCVLVGATFLWSDSRPARSVALVLGAMPVLVAITSLDMILSSTPTFLFSPAYLAREIQNQRIPTNELRLSNLSRNTVFGLNFYLDEEVSAWNRDTAREVYVLTKGRGTACREMPTEMRCKDEWLDEERLDTFALVHLTPKASVSHRTDSRQPQ